MPSRIERSLLRHFESLLKNNARTEIERDKTPAEREIVNHVIASLPRFVEHYGLLPVKGISEDAVHILDREKLAEQDRADLASWDVGGWYDVAHQRVFVMSGESALRTAERVVHELLHLESATTLKADQRLEGTVPTIAEFRRRKLYPRRIGFSVFDKTGKTRFFRQIDEAVIEELARRFDEGSFKQIPSLKKEIEERERVRQRASSRVDNISAVTTEQRPDGMWETKIFEYAYRAERQQLGDLIRGLYERNQDAYGSKEEVFGLFAHAALTGELLQVARLIERTYGTGSFRELGERAARSVSRTQGQTG